MNSADLESAWNSAWPVITAAVTIASLLDGALPQPAPGSNWLPLRKVISFIAINVGNASNGNQPSFLTWIFRIIYPGKSQPNQTIAVGDTNMSKISDAISVAQTKTAALQAQIDALSADKALVDKFIGEVSQLSADSVSLFDKLAADLAATPEQ